MKRTLLLVGTLGAGLAALAYGLYRKVFLAGTPLIVYAGSGSGSGEFRTVANRLAAVLGSPRVVSISDGAQALTAIRTHPGRIETLILVGHGTTTRFFSNLGSPVTPQALSAALSGKLAADAVVSLAGCRAAANPGEDDWSVGAFGPGGAGSFAGLLRNALISAGVPHGVEVRGHSTTGTTTANPAVRFFRAQPAQAGRPGQSALEALWGVGAAQDAALRARWTAEFRGGWAEVYMAGGPLRVG